MAAGRRESGSDNVAGWGVPTSDLESRRTPGKNGPIQAGSQESPTPPRLKRQRQGNLGRHPLCNEVPPEAPRSPQAAALRAQAARGCERIDPDGKALGLSRLVPTTKNEHGEAK